MNQRNNNGNRTGYWEVYHPNGQLIYKGHYDNGKLVGYWERYFYNGKLMNKVLYV